jgi:hypothetical protein
MAVKKVPGAAVDGASEPGSLAQAQQDRER